jgi:hypothetical protein
MGLPRRIVEPKMAAARQASHHPRRGENKPAYQASRHSQADAGPADQLDQPEEHQRDDGQQDHDQPGGLAQKTNIRAASATAPIRRPLRCR